MSESSELTPARRLELEAMLLGLPEGGLFPLMLSASEMRWLLGSERERETLQHRVRELEIELTASRSRVSELEAASDDSHPNSIIDEVPEQLEGWSFQAGFYPLPPSEQLRLTTMKPPTVAPAFATVYPVLAEAARSVGYALAIHGTIQSDIDLIAVPWVEDAESEEELIAALCAATASTVNRDSDKDRPHGRRSIGILLGCGGFLDLTVMPLRSRELGEEDRGKVREALEDALELKTLGQSSACAYEHGDRLTERQNEQDMGAIEEKITEALSLPALQPRAETEGRVMT